MSQINKNINTKDQNNKNVLKVYPHFEVSFVIKFHFYEAEILINFDY